MNRDTDRLLYLGLGPLAAILLGVALVPLRGATVASNFAFAFLALTFAVGELGGRGAALATALVSALSLDFFLTRPYMRLAIHGQDDLIAFFGLAGCGLVAAALGSPRRARLEVSRQLRVLQAALEQVEPAAPAVARLRPLLDAARSAFPLSSLVVRDGTERLLAAAGFPAGETAPAVVNRPEALATAGQLLDWRRGAALPEDGLRIPLIAAGRPVGWLDLCGDGRPAGPDTRRALTALAHALAALLAPAASGENHTPPSAAWVVAGMGTTRG